VKYILENIDPSVADEGRYLADFDPNWLPTGVTIEQSGGRCGLATWTDDITKAMVFDTQEAAILLWRRQSNIAPLRADGKPNRPLTAYSVAIVPVP
jgi:hypothetical protein